MTDHSVTLPWPTFPEDLVISDLLKSSKEFQAFYQAERRKIVKPVCWAQDLSLPEGIDYRSTTLATNDQIVQVIRLRNIPVHVEEALKIAHELEHLILVEEGFPRTGVSSKNFETVSSTLNSMVADPLVSSRLQRYGFDLWEDYQREIKEDLRQLEKRPNIPLQRLDRLIWIFNYAGKMLDWELVGTSKGQNEFQVWFDSRYPEIAERGKKLIAMVKRIGYETPEKQTRLFKEIIRRHKLEGIVSV